MKITKMKFVYGFIACALMSLCACGEEDEPVVPEPDVPVVPDLEPEPEQVDYAPLCAFVDECAAKNDYLANFVLENSEFTATSNSKNSVTVGKGDAPYLTVGSDGNWEVDGKQTTVAANYPAIRHAMPKVAVSDKNELTIDGTSLGVKAGKKLHCVINAKKNLYFCYDTCTQALGSEMYTMYNPELPTNAKELNVLFIGNSFTVDATRHLAGMVGAFGVKNINISRLYYPGYTLPEYLENFYKDNTCAYSYLRYKNELPDFAGYMTKYDDNPSECFKKRTWDVVVIQGHTGREHTWVWGDGKLKTTVDGLVAEFHKLQPAKRPTVVYILSQTYARNSELLKDTFGNDRSKMFNATVDVAKRLMEETGVDYVISTGCALENLRTTSLNKTNDVDLSRGDLYHMDYGISSYAACCAVWETLFTRCLGYKVEDCTFRDLSESMEAKGRRTAISDTTAPIAQKAAHAAVEKPFEVTDLSAL